MQRPSLVLLVLAIALLVGCTKPRLDTSSAEHFRTSISAVRDKLPADARAAFDAALITLVTGNPPATTSTDAGDSKTRPPLPRLDALSPALREQLQGRTGREVIAIAKEREAQRQARRQRAEALARERERRQIMEEIRSLRARLEAFDLETLEDVSVISARLSVDERAEDDTSVVRDWFDISDLTPVSAQAAEASDESQLPEIELEIESQVRNGIYAVLFEVELLSIDTAERWRRFQTKQRFLRGLFYGQSATRRFTPEAFAELFGPDALDRPPALDSLVVVARPLRLYGADGQAFAGAELPEAELAQVQMLVDKLERHLAMAGGTEETASKSRNTSRAAADDAFVAEAQAINAWREASIARAFKAEAEAIRAERRAVEAAREPFYRFLIDQPRFYWSDSAVHRKPVIELRVRNNTSEPVSWCHCRGRLMSSERERPWVDAPLEHRLRGNLAPGETRDLRIVPNWLGPWGGAPKDRDDLRLEVELTKLIGEDRKALFSEDLSAQQTERLASLEALIAAKGW
ncbi:DUF6694 family lipoprotein [Halochromatium sp.]